MLLLHLIDLQGIQYEGMSRHGHTDTKLAQCIFWIAEWYQKAASGENIHIEIQKILHKQGLRYENGTEHFKQGEFIQGFLFCYAPKLSFPLFFFLFNYILFFSFLFFL